MRVDRRVSCRHDPSRLGTSGDGAYTSLRPSHRAFDRSRAVGIRTCKVNWLTLRHIAASLALVAAVAIDPAALNLPFDSVTKIFYKKIFSKGASEVILPA